MGILYIIRHAETDYNNKGIYIGKKDISINKNGIKQANYLGKLLKKEDVDLIVASSLTRATETANIINKYIKKDIIIDNHFAEVNIGDCEGLTNNEVFKIIKNEYHQDLYRFYKDGYRRGEKPQDVEKRVYDGLNNIKNNYPDKKIALITHGFIIRVINKHFNPQISFEDFFNFLVENAEIKVFDF